MIQIFRLFSISLSFFISSTFYAFCYEENIPQHDLSGFSNFAPTRSPTPLSHSFLSRLKLTAVFEKNGKDIKHKMTWHIFKSNFALNGKLPLITKAQGATVAFDLEPGSYLVHVSFGHAAAIKRITVNRNLVHETLILDAGGLKLDATCKNNSKNIKKDLRFSIFTYNQDSSKEKSLVISDIKPGVVARLNAGLYHVVSTYGSANAISSFDVRVESGKLTEAIIEHHAAEVTVKLVRESGGEALADTSLSILTDSGDLVVEKAGSYASAILMEGKYTVIAKNRNRIYQRDFFLENGRNQDIELNVNQNNASDDEFQGSGD